MATANERVQNEFISIKSTLNSILRPEYANQVKEIIFDRSVTMTKISSLASLLILHEVNSAVDRMDQQFFTQSGKQKIYRCFEAVTREHSDALPPVFRDDMNFGQLNGFEWPSKHCLGNSFNYYREQYVVNLQTNLNTHLESRLQRFVRMRCFNLNLHYHDYPHVFFDGTDIRNILKDVLKDQDYTDDDPMRVWKKDVLWQQLIEIGFPANANLKEYVKNDWFASIRPFIRIQREIESFLRNHADAIEQWKAFTKDPKNNEKPFGMRVPTVRNFTVTPNCDFHLKHIKIDITDCYWLTSKFGAIPKFINEKTGNLNKMPIEHYTSKDLLIDVKMERAAELFNHLFDMDKIRRNGKRAKGFYGQIVTDGVSASVIYVRQRQTTIFFCLLMIIAKWSKGHFVNVIGIDPGDKTWLAGVRRHIRSRVEVSSVNQCVFMSMFN